MSKVSVDIEYIVHGLTDIGYIISDCLQKDNNGRLWKIKFSNSEAIVTVYDTNNKNNTVVNGKPEEGEKEKLKKL